jgi:hypothetical protein
MRMAAPRAVLGASGSRPESVRWRLVHGRHVAERPSD